MGEGSFYKGTVRTSRFWAKVEGSHNFTDRDILCNTKAMLTDEIRYQILKAIKENPAMSQRELAAHLGVSLGKANYCLKELVKKGLVKVASFKSNPSKTVYVYLLTPGGIKEKTMVTMRFLKSKMHEYEAIKDEIERLKSELAQEDMV